MNAAAALGYKKERDDARSTLAFECKSHKVWHSKVPTVYQDTQILYSMDIVLQPQNRNYVAGIRVW